MGDRKKQKSGGKTSSLTNLKVTPHFLDHRYKIEEHNLTRSDTGLLKVFSLIPQGPDAPSFHARIDDGSANNRRSPELDIDIDGVGNKARRDFKANRNGYTGHHTDRSPTAQNRLFDVEIATPAGKVFEGEVSFNAHFSVTVNVGVYSTVTADARLVRATSSIRLCAWLKQLSEWIRAKF